MGMEPWSNNNAIEILSYAWYLATTSVNIKYKEKGIMSTRNLDL